MAKEDQKYPMTENTIGDIIKEVIFFFVVAALSFGWALLMLLIISFVTLGYLHFKFEKMLVAAAVFAIAVSLIYAVSKAGKYTKKLKK